MGPRFMDYPSPRGVHVAETYTSEDSDPYRRDSVPTPRRNRYSRSVHQTPRHRDVTWITSPEPTPQTPHAPSTPWLPSPQVPSSPAYRPPSAIPPSPAPTVGEHMAVDDILFMENDIMDPYAYQPQRQSGGTGLMKSFWKGLKRLAGYLPSPDVPRMSSYESPMVEMPVPEPSLPSEAATQYVNPTPPEMDEQQGTTPYTSLYVRPANLGATPAVISSSLRASPARMPSMEIPPPITVVSPSIPPSPLPNSIRSGRIASPAMGVPRNLSVREPELATPSPGESSQTLHEPAFPEPGLPPLSIPVVLAPPADPNFRVGYKAVAFDEPSVSSPKSSLSSTVARFRRFVSEVDGLPWVSDNQIADEYLPDRNPRSRLRARVRQGAEPSWYNPRTVEEERPEYWSEWDMWAKQSASALWNGGVGGERRPVGWPGPGVGVGASGPGQWGAPMYPHGYAPVQPEFVYASGYPPPGMVNEPVHAPVVP